MRAEFSPKTKKALAGRVGYRCSFPGCHSLTIGPGHGHEDDVVNLGDAAHIWGASAVGPRPNPALTPKQRSSINNGIWMCKGHARLIDVDEVNYSADTLRQWKMQAEQKASRSLSGLTRLETYDGSTLVSITSELVFIARWISVRQNEWVFTILSHLEGTDAELFSFSMNFAHLPQWKKFIVVESQGDGREMKDFSWRRNQEGQVEISCEVAAPHARVDPTCMHDLALDENFDLLETESGDLSSIQGISAAIQSLRMTLNTSLGDYLLEPALGSHTRHYLKKYKDDVVLLGRMIKLDIIRQLSVSIPTLDSNLTPSLNFISRVLSVSVRFSGESLLLNIHLVWGNNQQWSGEICIRPTCQPANEDILAEEDEVILYWINKLKQKFLL